MLKKMPASSSPTPLHPGQYVRETILIPKRMSVTQAATIIGVSRPGVSNFLNGKVTTTSDMASRIERAFGIPAQTLLDMQAAYEAVQAKSRGTPANTKSYVPPFLALKANDIEKWATAEITARTRLSVFLRTLVHSTGIDLKKVAFPGNDDAERPGWDGFIEAAAGTPWIPEGLSGWEFGVNHDIKGKADSDFAKSVKATSKADRDQTTFVFVTPRRWKGKDDWIRAMKETRQWKDARVYDSSDLEQWLEQSLAGQSWFANETLQPSEGVRSLDRCWSDWAAVTSPPLTGSLFQTAIAAARRTMVSRLSAPPDGPTVVAADSYQEALAFLAQLFKTEDEDLGGYRDRVLIFDKPGVLPRLAQGAQNFISVAFDREVERELGPVARSMHSIVVYPRNAANAEPHILLEPVHYEAFRTSLKEMGYRDDDVTKYSDASGRSLTVLRRQMSSLPAIKTPEWAANETTATSLIPFLFVGAWNSRNDADQTALTLLADAKSYDVVEKNCQRLAQLNDAPVWSVGNFRGVISKIDLLFAVAWSITEMDIKRYLDLARIVLGEDDPKLDLPESERWAAAMHGKLREFSSALREGISETLVLLAVHGNHLFKARLGVDTAGEAARLVRDLLKPLTTRNFEANDRDLPTYAEAAPEEFLSILEQDLKSEQPAMFGLLRSVDTGIFGSCPRTGLLWALEGLAWNPKTLPRAALILARLSEIEIEDNWVNKPINSLRSIFRAWMPQTAASHEERLATARMLADKFPNAAWQICIDQFGNEGQSGHYSHKPKWRADGYGFGEPFSTWGPIRTFVRDVIDMALGWKEYSRGMLCDLVQRVGDLPEDDQKRVWELVKAWAASATDFDKALVREKVRVTVMSRRSAKRLKGGGASRLVAAAKEAYAALEPSDLLNRHEWLFRRAWVEESADEIEEEVFDYRKREERIAKLRTATLREVFAERDLTGVLELAEKGEAGAQIGWILAKEILSDDQIPSLLLMALKLALEKNSWPLKSVIQGAVRAIKVEEFRGVVDKLERRIPQKDLVALLLLAPFRQSTWQIVDRLDEVNRAEYWQAVSPDWIFEFEDENEEAVERLLTAKRPRAAFAAIHFALEKITPALLVRLLSDMVKDGNDKPGHYRMEQHDIQRAFVFIDKNPEISLDEKAGLEFAYIDALSEGLGKKSNVPNLERYTQAHPELFIQAIVWTYRRKDDGEDPPEWRVAPESATDFGTRGYKLLDALQLTPGHDDFGELKAELLSKWIKTVRETCSQLARGEIADICIGKLLAHAPADGEGVWPCEPVRDVMEDLQSEKISQGACTGLYNLRGVHWKGEGGQEERQLAERYKIWAQALRFSHPFISGSLLSNMVKTYESEASREDTEAEIRRRLR
jgi:addiction module HigA family antidote